MNECYLKYQGFREHKKKSKYCGFRSTVAASDCSTATVRFIFSFHNGGSFVQQRQTMQEGQITHPMISYDTSLRCVCAISYAPAIFKGHTERERNLVLCEKKVFFQLVVLFSFNSSAYLADDVENEDADNESNCKVHHLILLTERKIVRCRFIFHRPFYFLYRNCYIYENKSLTGVSWKREPSSV